MLNWLDAELNSLVMKNMYQFGAQATISGFGDCDIFRQKERGETQSDDRSQEATASLEDERQIFQTIISYPGLQRNILGSCAYLAK
jgi:hypothetical protein